MNEVLRQFRIKNFAQSLQSWENNVEYTHDSWGMNYLRSSMCNFWGANMYGPIIPTKPL